jgi:hypothetical protein
MRTRDPLVLLGLCGAALLACSDSKQKPQAPEDVGRYQLACDTNDTESLSEWKCLRLDSRRGSAVYVDLNRVTVSDGRGFESPSEVGRYRAYCNSTRTAHEANFRCVRLDAKTGDVMLQPVDKLGTVP